LTALLLSSVAAAGLPLVLLAGGWLQLRRDLLLFAIYLQGLLYVHVGPYLYARARAPLPLDAYRSFALAALPLFDAALLIAYVLVLGVRRARVRFAPPEKLELSERRFKLLVFALLAFALTFWSVAWSAGLMYRRIGVNILVTQQLNLPFASFFVFRLYIESLRYVIAVVVLGLVLGGRRLGWPGSAAALALLLSGYVYLVINSRIDLALNLLVGLAVWSFFWRGRGRFWPRFAGACAVAAVLLLYSISTTERVRVGFARSWTVEWRAFVPGMSLGKRVTAPGRAASAAPGFAEAEAEAAATAVVASKPLLLAAPVEMPMSLRLNGLDLMARMRPELEAYGYAWGRAWKVPAALVFLPVVNPRKARAYKLGYDLAAKNYLMREYTDMEDLDYVSCMLTDAYGNFGHAGILAVGLFLGAACALAVRIMAAAPRAALVLVALFTVCHIFQFEQEFISALLFWVKKLPLLLGVLVIAPLWIRRAAGRPARASGG
jgi:hypothetical protein